MKKYESGNKNSSQKAVFSQFFSENLTKRFFAEPEGHTNNEETLIVIRRRTLKAIFQVMRVAVNYRKGQKQLKKIAVHLKTTLARPPSYDGAYPEKLSTAFLGNPVDVTKPSLLELFVQQDKMSCEESTSLKETYFLTNFWQWNHEKSSLGV